jgi:hypothetical protein
MNQMCLERLGQVAYRRKCMQIDREIETTVLRPHHQQVQDVASSLYEGHV